MISENSTYLIQLSLKYKWRAGAELGVRRGDFSHSLLSQVNDLHLTCVDLWSNDPSFNEKHNHDENFEIFSNKCKQYKDRLTIIRKLTHIASNDIQDNSLDFVFVDATHTYDAVRQDCISWIPKIKNDGILSGHDYNEAFDRGGVVRAVQSFGDIKEYPVQKNEHIWINVENVLRDIMGGKNVADRQTGCWFIWKKNICLK